MKLWTVQIAKWRLCKTRGVEMIDTTVKSGNPIFAPSWDIVARVKAGTLTEDGYTEQYYAMMRESFRRHPAEWRAMCEQAEVAIACYCTAGKFCHRHLLKDMLERACRHFGIPFEYQGELA